MLLRSLQNRLVLVFVGLFVLVMAMVLALVTRSNARIVAAEVERELSAGAQVFSLLIEQNRKQLETAATVLSADYAFREAIATRDRPTIASVIRNHGLRIGAQVMMVINPEGQVIADTQGQGAPARAFPFPDLLSAAESAGRSTGFRQMRDGRLYQIVLVPIRAPRLIAWVAMGFLADDHWAQDLAGVTGLSVSVIRRNGAAAAVLVSSSEEAKRSALAATLRQLADDTPDVRRIGTERFETVQVPLGIDTAVLLQRSVEQATAPFRSLQTVLWLIVFAGAAVFAIGSIMLARRVVRPVNQLAAAARRIEDGDYAEAVPKLSSDEIGQLATSFDHMRERVADREQKILKLAYEDSLTGLPNRTRFIEEFNRLPASSRGAVAVMNLDRFAPINNALGHPVGDRLLAEIGRRLGALQSGSSLVGRFWGDEFVMLWRDADRGAASDLASRLIDMLRDPVLLDGQRIDVDASLGIALYPDDGRDAATLLRRAELAMYAAKRRRSSVAFAVELGGEPPHEQLSLIGEMREALARREFRLDFQPKLDVASRTISGVEALIRWQHPRRGLLMPAGFIPFAEQTGFIRELTPWVLEAVAAQLGRWREQGLALTAAINLSALDLLNPQLVEHLRRLVRVHDLSAQMLCLEITESALMEDPELALAHLHELAGMGLKLAIDDYGVGQASLAYLQTLPVHELKIDRSFVRDVARTPRNAAIVQSTIVLGHALGLTVVGEGTETPDGLAWLIRNQCDVAQGYVIARPMPADELPAWLAGYRVPASQPA